VGMCFFGYLFDERHETGGEMLKVATGKCSRGLPNRAPRVIEQVFRARGRFQGMAETKKKGEWKLSSAKTAEYPLPAS